MAKKALPAALRKYQFKKGSKKPKKVGAKGGRRKPSTKGKGAKKSGGKKK